MGSEENMFDPSSSSFPDDSDEQDAAMALSEMNEKETERLKAALEYIFVMMSVQQVRSAVLQCEGILGILASLITSDHMPGIQLESVRIVAKLAPHAGSVDLNLDPCLVGKLLLSA